MSEAQRLSDLMYLMRQCFVGCSDGHCAIRGKAIGQHTNGGCRCIKSIADVALELAAEADKLKNRCGITVPDTRSERVL